MWLSLSIIGYVLLGVVFVMDKFILSKSVARPAVYAFYSTVPAFLAFFAWPFGVQLPHGVDIVWAIASGLLFGLGMHTLFLAVKAGEASHINPFTGAVITIVTYALSAVALGEQLSRAEIAGVMVLTLASVLLSYETSRVHHGWHAGYLWAILSGIAFAISLVIVKYFYEHYSFITGLVWTRGTSGLYALLLLLFPSVRRALFKSRPRAFKTYGKRHALGLVLADKILSVIGIVLLHYAIAIGSVTLVNALEGVQYVFMFILIYLSTRFFPRVFKEYFTKRELIIETIAIVLVAVGSVLFVL